MANSQSHIRKIADKKTTYNEGRLYAEEKNCNLGTNLELFRVEEKRDGDEKETSAANQETTPPHANPMTIGGIWNE